MIVRKRGKAMWTVSGGDASIRRMKSLSRAHVSRLSNRFCIQHCVSSRSKTMPGTWDHSLNEWMDEWNVCLCVWKCILSQQYKIYTKIPYCIAWTPLGSHSFIALCASWHMCALCGPDMAKRLFLQPNQCQMAFSHPQLYFSVTQFAIPFHRALHSYPHSSCMCICVCVASLSPPSKTSIYHSMHKPIDIIVIVITCRLSFLVGNSETTNEHQPWHIWHMADTSI